MSSNISAQYIAHLEELLNRVKGVIADSCLINLKENTINYELAEDYISALNTYYYKSFHDHFFPYYQKAIITELESLWDIKQGQDMIIQDLLTNLKRYAKLYNQVKVVNKLLANTREEFNTSLYMVYREKAVANTELLYILKGFHFNLTSLQNVINLVNDLIAKKDYLDAVRLHPNMPKILAKTYKTTSYQLDNVTKLIVKLKAMLLLITQLQTASISNKLVASVLDELTNQIKIINNEKGWTILPRPFTKDFNVQAQNFIELVTAYNQLNKLDKIAPFAKRYEDLLLSFLIILDKGIEFLDTNHSRLAVDLLTHSLAIGDLSKHSFANLKQNISDLKTKVDEINNNITVAGEPDFSYLAKAATSLIEDYPIKIQPLILNEDFMFIPLLANLLNTINLDFSLLERELRLIEEKHNLAKLLEGKYLSLINILDSYLNFINSTRGDLERILAPRNLSRVWKNFNVKVERIPLETGKPFPLNYAKVTEQAEVKKQIDPSKNNLILHEEGDIFIISIDNIIAYEIPPFTIA